MPGPPVVTVSPILNVNSPSSTQAISSLSRCRWSQLFLAPAGTVCSNRVTLSPVSRPNSFMDMTWPDASSRCLPPPGGTNTPLFMVMAISLVAATRSELLHHVMARDAGRVAIDRRRHLVALLDVEAGRLDAERRQRHARTAAPPRLFLGHRQHAAADPGAAQVLGEKQPVDIDQPEFGPPVESADYLAGLRIAHGNGEPAKIAVADL